MSESKPSDELLALFEEVLCQRADKQKFAKLESLLDRDEAARRLFALYSTLSADLRHAYRTGQMGGLPGSRKPEPLAAPSMGFRPPPTAYFWAFALAGSILLAAFLPLLQEAGGPAVVEAEAPATASKPPAPVATLTKNRDAVWVGQPIIDGDAIHEGRKLVLADGEAHISVGSGAEMVARGPCSLTLVSADRVHLHAGNVAVHVAEWAHGFTVATDEMEVIDLGTTFTVSASEGDGAETTVLKGQVRVNPKREPDSGPRSVLVNEGQAVKVDNLGGLLKRISGVEPPQEMIDFGALEPYRPIALFNTGFGLAEGDEDSHWRVTKSTSDDVPVPEFAMVCKPDERYLPNDPKTSQWVSMPGWLTAKPNTSYTFQTRFDLTGFDLRTVQFFGRFLADNGIEQVRVNGQPVEVESWVDNVEWQSFGHSQFRFVNVTSGLISGVNTVEIDVRNGMFKIPVEWRDDPNPMALRVEWYAFGRHLRELVSESSDAAEAGDKRPPI